MIQGAIERTRLVRELEAKIAELDAAHGGLQDVKAKLLKAFL